MRRLLLPLIPALLTLAGCSTAHHATMRDATSDTVRIVVSRADTLRIADSTVIDRSADTVRIDRWRTVERRTVIRDTLWRSRTDTVSVAVPVAGKPTRRDRAASWLAGAATGAIAILILLLWRRARR